MPFKSEKQRRYLWANEPEIARDWTDTYGSRIQKNTGGISQLVKPGVGRPGYRGDAAYRALVNNLKVLDRDTSDRQKVLVVVKVQIQRVKVKGLAVRIEQKLRTNKLQTQ